MSGKLTIVFLLTCISAISQTGTVTVKKRLPQDKMSTVVTIGGLYYGVTPIEKFLSDKKLKLSNTNINIKIIDFEVSILSIEGSHTYFCKSDTLSNDVVAKLISGKDLKRMTVYISPIRAVAAGQDTLILNPIEIYIK